MSSVTSINSHQHSSTSHLSIQSQNVHTIWNFSHQFINPSIICTFIPSIIVFLNISFTFQKKSHRTSQSRCGQMCLMIDFKISHPNPYILTCQLRDLFSEILDIFFYPSSDVFLVVPFWILFFIIHPLEKKIKKISSTLSTQKNHKQKNMRVIIMRAYVSFFCLLNVVIVIIFNGTIEGSTVDFFLLFVPINHKKSCKVIISFCLFFSLSVVS